MFNTVRILDHKGKTKKVLSKKFLSKRHWNAFYENTSKTEAPKNSKIKAKKKQTAQNRCDENVFDIFKD